MMKTNYSEGEDESIPFTKMYTNYPPRWRQAYSKFFLAYKGHTNRLPHATQPSRKLSHFLSPKHPAAGEKSLSEICPSRLGMSSSRPPVKMNKKSSATLMGGSHLMFLSLDAFWIFGMNCDKSFFGINFFHGGGQNRDFCETVTLCIALFVHERS